MEKNISITLSKLQRIFIPAFFDVMVHLVVHLATEAKLAGPVHYRWMYRFEREMHTFKSYVRNKARPEGSIAEAYIADECLTFCSRYLTKTETQFNRVQRNDYPIESCSFGLSIFSKLGKPLGKASYNHLSFDEWRQAQSYVLKNCPEVDPFLRAMNSLQSHSQSVQQDKGSTGSVYSEGSCSSYRENRRLQQSQATNGKNTRGRTRGIKWQIERKRKLGVKPSCHITKDMKRIIGDNADQFITEVGHWVRNTLSLRCSRWKAMDNMYKERLLKKIQAEWNLPDEESVNRVVENQCKALYRQWRYRLKEQYFDWKWIVENYWGSEKQKHISQINRDNRAKQKVKAVQGSKSTARILDLLRKTRRLAVSSEAYEEAPQSTEDGSEACGASEPPPPPEYISLWELTKRHKDKSIDKFVEDKLEEFKQLHEEQLKENGVDNLTVEEAYMRVLGTSSGYINGLGYGPKPPKAKSGRVTYEESMQLKEQIQVLQQDKISMLEEIKKMKQDAMEREEKMKQDAMEREEKMKQDSKEREERMRKEFRLMMQEQLRAFTSGQMNLHK